jgi:hypothetical protein
MRGGILAAKAGSPKNLLMDWFVAFDNRQEGVVG